MPTFDVIVIGAGGIGSAAMYALARRGASVLGLDRFPPPHDQGSSHGQTRIIRQAYFEHPDYVPLVVRCYPMWQALEAEVGRRLFVQTGLLQVGPGEGAVVQGVLRSAAEHGLALEQLSPAEMEARWPLRASYAGDAAQAESLRWVGLFEQQAGYLLVEQCVQAHLTAAERAGAELQTGHAVHRWRREGSGFHVETDQGAFSASKLVVTAGAWAGALLQELGLRLEIRKKPLYWYQCEDARYQAASGMPAVLYELPEGVFYGFPPVDQLGVKLARHDGGTPVDDPSQLDRSTDAADRQAVELFAERYLRGVSSRLTKTSVCMYTMTPDDHFIVDRHPADPDVVLAAGMSGHGFKFAPILGEALADLALDGKSDLPIEFLSLARPGLRNAS